MFYDSRVEAVKTLFLPFLLFTQCAQVGEYVDYIVLFSTCLSSFLNKELYGTRSNCIKQIFSLDNFDMAVDSSPVGTFVH